jgi:hypothetical protein
VSATCVTLRHATQEQAFRILPLLGFPVRGRERDPSTCDLALWPTERGDWYAARLAAHARQAFDDPWDGDARARRRRLTESLVLVEGEGVSVLAVKPASRGAGVRRL